MPAIVFRFISRAEQPRLRGQRNFNRYMFITKGFVAGDSLERAQWQREFAQESKWDAEWNRHHGPVPGCATILQWRLEREEESRAGLLPSADATIG